MFTVKVRDDVSVAQLRDLKRNHPVVKLPHVGNLSISNLFAAQCGFDMVLIDTTIPARDVSGNPHLRIKDGVAHQLTDEEQASRIISMSVKVTNPIDDFSFGEPVADGHIRKIRAIRPRQSFSVQSIMTENEFLEMYRCSVLPILVVATKALPKFWRRWVNEYGVLREGKGLEENEITWDNFLFQGLVSPGKPGRVLPNIFRILVHACALYKNSGVTEVWMLSGRDFAAYVPQMEPELRIAYEAVSKALGLPRDLTLHVAPFANFRFVGRTSDHDRIVETFVHTRNGIRNKQAFGELAGSCPDLWYQTRKRNYFTQHDMTRADDIRPVEDLLDWKLSEVAELWQKARLIVPKQYRYG